MDFKDRQIYITGIAGFIGYHLAAKLKHLGAHVTGIDNFNEAYPPQIKFEREKELNKLGIEVNHIPLSEQKNLFLETKPSVVIHLAAQAGVRASLDHPDIFVETNIQDFVSLLELTRIHAPEKFIFASSSSVYGDNQKFPLTESDMTDHPVSLYGATKKANELIAYAYHNMTKVPTIGLRFFTCYGPYGRPDMAIFKFVHNIYNGLPITVYNEGKMKRDFTYVDDIVNGIIASIDHDTSFDVFNLGKGKTDDLTTLISLIEKRLEKKAIIDYQPRPFVDMPLNIADIEKSSQKLNFTPSTPLEEGLNNFIDWYLSKQPSHAL